MVTTVCNATESWSAWLQKAIISIFLRMAKFPQQLQRQNSDSQVIWLFWNIEQIIMNIPKPV